MSEDIDVQIEKKETELSFFLQCMEELKCEFTKETINFASEWYKKTAKEYVRKYPEVTLSLKEPQIARMKTQVNGLISDTEKIVQAEFGNSALWWHQKLRLHESIELYLQVADKYPEILDRAVRHVLGRLGLILEEYRFNVSARSEIGSYKEFWFEKTDGENSISVPSYPHLLTWSKEMQQTIQKYHAQYTKAMPLYGEIQKFKEEKKKQEAIDRWDSI
jgi:predicted DNA binding CopG/RHH family protein